MSGRRLTPTNATNTHITVANSRLEEASYGGVRTHLDKGKETSGPNHNHNKLQMIIPRTVSDPHKATTLTSEYQDVGRELQHLMLNTAIPSQDVS